MGRWRDAWKVLRGKADALPPDAVQQVEEERERTLLECDERYIRRDEVRELTQLMTELNLEMSSHFDKLNTLAARLRKRDQRASTAADTDDEPHAAPDATNGSRHAQKAELARRVIHGGIR